MGFEFLEAQDALDVKAASCHSLHWTSRLTNAEKHILHLGPGSPNPGNLLTSLAAETLKDSCPQCRSSYRQSKALEDKKPSSPLASLAL